LINETAIEVNLEVKPYNIDAAGHVNNAVYINWLEDMRIKLFQKIIPLDEIIKKGYHLVVASTTIEYKNPLYLFDQPTCKVRIEKYERGIWFISFIIELENKIIARAKQKCVLIDNKSKKMVKYNFEFENEIKRDKI
jgi:acyl-CoA thioester hydrolase